MFKMIPIFWVLFLIAGLAYSRSSAPLGRVYRVSGTLASDGSMKGTWYTKKDPLHLGTEVLIPRK